MSGLEPCCLAIVALYLLVRIRTGPNNRRFLRRMSLLVLCSWVAENTVIHAYGFYFYKPVWSLFVDQVPLVIVLIWPVVILSAHDLATQLKSGSARQMAIITGAFVFADAWLIEPIAVQSGLWAWTEPGLFNVPPIGVLGWAFFTAICIAIFENNDRHTRNAVHDLKVLVLAPIGTHLLLVITWWFALRWVNHSVPSTVAVIGTWLLSLTLTRLAIRHRLAPKVGLPLMMTRVLAAAFFFVLLALYANEQPALILFALAFVPPYLALTPFPSRKTHSRSA